MFLSKHSSNIEFIRDPSMVSSSFNFNNDRFNKKFTLSDYYLKHFNLEFIPRLFTITTNNSSGQFNVELLKNTSSVINVFLKENPNSVQYHIDVNDDENILSKFEQMYKGEKVIFDEDDLPVSKKITKALNIINCPNYMKPESLKIDESNNNHFTRGLESGVGINISSFNNFIQNNKFRTFKIITHKNEYLCNFFGVCASEVLRDFIMKNPTINEYTYDFDDEFDEFNPICDLFNFQLFNVTPNNMHSLKQIAEDLKIAYVIPKIEKDINEYENVSKAIDEHQAIVDSIEELFKWLYNIQKLTVDFVKNSIVQSNWSKSEDNIYELGAFILQVINTSHSLHSYIFDLLTQLDKESNESNDLNLLFPFIIKQLKFSFGESSQNCSFIYSLYKNGFIQKEELLGLIKKNIYENRGKNRKKFVYSWFLPEIIELKLFDKRFIDINNNDNNINKSIKSINKIANFSNDLSGQRFSAFIKDYYPDKIDLYTKMRDSGQSDDELTNALHHDDIDKVQLILTSRNTDLSQYTIPYNIFEDAFTDNDEINLIDYAAAYGSIKCFKYLMLNHLKMTDYTFYCAVLGGNTEIIKIVSQNTEIIKTVSQNAEINNILNYRFSGKGGDNSFRQIKPAISMHRNDLFDWILEQKFSSQNIIESFNALLAFSAKNGNAHAFIEIFDKIATTCDAQNFIHLAAENGFYKLTKLILNLKGKQSEEFERDSGTKNENIGLDDTIIIYDPSYICFGNLSIFKLCPKKKSFLTFNHKDIENCLTYSIEKDYMSIFKYIFDIVLKDKLTKSVALIAINSSIDSKNDFYIKYLIENIKATKPNIFNRLYFFGKLLKKACDAENIEYVKIIMNVIIEFKIMTDFTSAFVNAILSKSKEICQYFIDQKVLINYNEILSKIVYTAVENKDLFTLIYDNADSETKENLLTLSLYPAIKNKQTNMIEFLLNKDVDYDFALIKAVDTRDIDVVNIILKYDSKPSFINKKSYDGSTALSIAVSHNDEQIVKRLLEIPGIDPSLYDSRNIIPLITSIENFNINIMNMILDFYGSNIQSQSWQLESAIKITLKMLSRDYEKDEKEKLLVILKRILNVEGINPNIRKDKHTLLSYACKANELNIVQMLLETKNIKHK